MTVSAEQEFPGVPASARSARAFVAALVTDPRLRDTVVLAVDELAANAIQHSRSGSPGGTFTVYIEVSDDDEDKTWTYVEVSDRGGGVIPLDRHEFSTDAIDGRGLGIVDALAVEWGVVSRRDGNHVWGRFVSDPESHDLTARHEHAR